MKHRVAPPPVRAAESLLSADQGGVCIPSDGVELAGDIVIPSGAKGVVLFAHGSGSSRHSPRNQHVARTVQAAGVGTMLFDLLTMAEEEQDAFTGHLRFDIDRLARRLLGATHWLRRQPALARLGLGYFGASTGGAAALVAAAKLPDDIQAVVSRGGRPDLAGNALPRVIAPTLLIVGGLDHQVLHLNREAYARLRCEKRLEIVPGATHLFEEPGALDEVARLAAAWFQTHLDSV